VFPDCAFVLVMRHPVAVAGATKKWVRGGSYGSLIAHWLKAYETMVADIPYLDRVTVIRYEDLLADPTGVVRRVYSDLELAPHVPSDVAITEGINDKYFAIWDRPGLRARRIRERTTNRFEARVGRFSYGFNSSVPISPLRIEPLHFDP